MKKCQGLVAAYSRNEDDCEDKNPKLQNSRIRDTEQNSPKIEIVITGNGDDADKNLLKNAASPAVKTANSSENDKVQTNNLALAETFKNKRLSTEQILSYEASPPEEQPSLDKIKRVRKLHDMVKKENYNVNDVLRQNKEFINPYVLSNLLHNSKLSVNENGTNFSPHIFEPQRFPDSDYCNSLLQRLKEMYNKKPQKRNITPLELAQALPNNKLSARTSNILKMNMERNNK